MAEGAKDRSIHRWVSVLVRMPLEQREELKTRARAEGCSVQALILRAVFGLSEGQDRLPGPYSSSHDLDEGHTDNLPSDHSSPRSEEIPTRVPAKGGRPYRAGVPRRRISVSLPRTICETAAAKAKELGIPFSDVLAVYLYLGLDLPIPAYLSKGFEPTAFDKERHNVAEAHAMLAERYPEWARSEELFLAQCGLSAPDQSCRVETA